MSTSSSLSLFDLNRILRAYRYTVRTEASFQSAIAQALSRAGINYRREVHLADAGIIDFYLPDQRTGIECKVKGSPSDVARQCIEYAASPDLDALLLATTKSTAASGLLSAHRSRLLQGKPFRIARLCFSTF